jgi:hypothetical protein
MHKGIQKRAHERLPTSCQFRVTTSLSRISYGVHVSNISRAGAFIISDHIPPVGEIINIEVLDSYGRKLFNCSSQVKNVRNNFNEFGSKLGFGVQFTEALTLDQLDQLTEG